MSERLSDERIAAIVTANASAYVEPEGLAMAREIQERRAASLTPMELRELRMHYSRLSARWRPSGLEPLLAKILSAHGVRL